MEWKGIFDNGGVEGAVGGRNHRHRHRNRAVRASVGRDGGRLRSRLGEHAVVPGEREGALADGGVEVGGEVREDRKANGQDAVATRRVREILGVGSGFGIRAVVVAEGQGVFDNGGVERAVGRRNHRQRHRNRAVRAGVGRDGGGLHARFGENAVVPDDGKLAFADDGIYLRSDIREDRQRDGEDAVARGDVCQILGIGTSPEIGTVVVAEGQRILHDGGVEGTVGGRDHREGHHHSAVRAVGGEDGGGFRARFSEHAVVPEDGQLAFADNGIHKRGHILENVDHDGQHAVAARRVRQVLGVGSGFRIHAVVVGVRQGVLDDGQRHSAVGRRDFRHRHHHQTVRTARRRQQHTVRARRRKFHTVPNNRETALADGGIHLHHNVNLKGEDAVAARRVRKILGVGSGHRVETVVIEHRQRVHVHGGVEGAVGRRNHRQRHRNRAVRTVRCLQHRLQRARMFERHPVPLVWQFRHTDGHRVNHTVIDRHAHRIRD